MNLIRYLTRFLAGLGEIVNILAIAPVAALGYTSMFDRLLLHGITTGTLPPESDPATYISAGFAIMLVGFINGGFAVLFNIRRLLDYDNGHDQDMPPRPKS